MRGSRKLCQRGSSSILTTFLSVDDNEGWKGESGSKIPLKVGYHQMAVRLRADNGATLIPALVALLFPRDPYQYC